MQKLTKAVLYSVIVALCTATIVICTLFLSNWGAFIKVVVYGLSAAGIIAGAVFLIIKKDALFKTCFILVCVLAFVCALVVALSEIGNLGNLSSDEARIDKLTDIIKETGSWGMFVYFLIQVLQVVIIPLPAAVCYMPGATIWGAGVATLLASAGVLVGSVMSYWLGRLLGRKVVVWIAGEESTDKYAGYIAKKGKVPFILMQILPFFPDDILCLVAGMTRMNFAFFTAVMIIVRPCIVAVYCFAVDLIPFSGWGIAVWIAVIAACIVLTVLAFRYQDKIESFVLRPFKRKSAPATEEVQAQTSRGTAGVAADKTQSDVKQPLGADDGKPEESGKNSLTLKPDDGKR